MFNRTSLLAEPYFSQQYFSRKIFQLTVFLADSVLANSQYLSPSDFFLPVLDESGPNSDKYFVR